MCGCGGRAMRYLTQVCAQLLSVRTCPLLAITISYSETLRVLGWVQVLKAALLQAKADLVWANDLDHRHGDVIMRNLSACLEDDQPKLVNPLPALLRPVLEVTNHIALDRASRSSRNSSSSDDKAAPFTKARVTHTSDDFVASMEHALSSLDEEDEEGEGGQAAHAPESIDQSPSSLFYSAAELEGASIAQRTPEASVHVGVQRALISHADGVLP
jgi:hypothetical protein